MDIACWDISQIVQNQGFLGFLGHVPWIGTSPKPLKKFVGIDDYTFKQSRACYDKQLANHKSIGMPVTNNPRYNILSREDMWTAASGGFHSTHHSSQDLTMFKLFYRCLPTFHNVQILNECLPEQKLYPNSICPLCNQHVGNEYHIFCKCSALHEHRWRAFENFIIGMEKDLNKGNDGEKM